MHKAVLVVKHATGITERTKAKKVEDMNQPFLFTLQEVP
jgi:hypothetical protein